MQLFLSLEPTGSEKLEKKGGYIDEYRIYRLVEIKETFFFFKKKKTFKLYMAPHALLNQQAPADIIVKNQHDEEVSTSDFIGKSTVVLFFYPKNNGFLCNKEVKQRCCISRVYFLS